MNGPLIVVAECCCETTTTCPVNWGSCSDTMLVSLAGLGIGSRVKACETETCSADSVLTPACASATYNTTYVRQMDITLALDELVFDRAVGTTPYTGTSSVTHYRLASVGSNSGTCDYSLSDIGADYIYDSSGRASSSPWHYDRSASGSTGGTGTFSQTFSGLGPDVSVNYFDGYIYAADLGAGCKFVLRFIIDVYLPDGFNYDVMTVAALEPDPSSLGNYTANILTQSAVIGFRVEVFATATYSSSLCPHEASWTIQALSFYPYGPREPIPVVSLPHSAEVDDCLSVDCGDDLSDPGVCGDDDSFGDPYVELAQAIDSPLGFRRQYTQDDPSLSVVAG